MAMEGPKWHAGAAALAVVACLVFMEAQNASVVAKNDGVGKKVSMFDGLVDQLLGPDEKPPVPRIGKDEVLIQFCMNWSYKGYYQQVGQLLNQRATSALKVIPAEFPLTKRVQLMQSVMQFATMALMVILFAYPKILPNGWQENKAGTFLFIWIGSSVVSSFLTKSNAFEIYLGAGRSSDPELVWSSLKNERLPSMNDLVDGFGTVGIEIIPPRGP